MRAALGTTALIALMLSLALEAPTLHAEGSSSPSADAPTAGSINLKSKIHDFLQASRDLRRKIEDKWIGGERQFQDDLRKSLREFETKASHELSQSADWRKARRELQAKRREFEKDLKQRTKIRREELELELMRFINDREKEIKSFVGGVEDELKSFKGSTAATKAREEFRDAAEDIKSEFSRWKSSMKNLKTKEGFWE